MYPRSARFDKALAYSHTVAIEASLWSPGGVNLLMDGLAVTGGSVTASRSAAIRRQCTINLLDTDGGLARLFSSTRTIPPVELVVRRGIRYSDGSSELIPLGVFPVSAIAVTQKVVYTLTTYDRARRVARNRFTSPYVIPPGTRYVDAAAALVDDRLPFNVPINKDLATSQPDATSIPIAYLEQDDPLAKAGSLAAAVGCEIFFDVNGGLVIRDEPSTAAGPVDFAYLEGATSIILPETTLDLSDDPGYNAVLAVGENSGNDASIPRWGAYDNDPASPTYYFSDYGQVTEYYSDSAITNPEQARLVAESRLRRWLGRNDSITLAAIPHPAHDPSDVIRIRYGGLDQLMLLDSVTIPLDITTAASLTLRSQQALG